MNTPIRLYTGIKPNTLDDLGSGSWYYNYDIKDEGIWDNNPNNEPQQMYSYIQVKLPYKPTYKQCIEAIIREYISQTQEFDLINSANKLLIQGITEGNDIDKYKEYLTLVDEIKSKVKKDFNL